MIRNITGRSERIRLLLNQFAPQTMQRNFHALLQPLLLRLDDAKEDLLAAMQDRLREFKHRTALLKTELESASPHAVLARGYAIVNRRDNGLLVRSHGQVQKDDLIGIQLAEGALEAVVEKTEGGNQR